jgi:hypothetical protein
MTLDERTNHKWLWNEPRTENYKPTKNKCWRDGKNILKNTWKWTHEGSKSEQPTRPVDSKDDGVDIDLPNYEEIDRALKYLKNRRKF